MVQQPDMHTHAHELRKTGFNAQKESMNHCGVTTKYGTSSALDRSQGSKKTEP